MCRSFADQELKLLSAAKHYLYLSVQAAASLQPDQITALLCALCKPRALWEEPDLPGCLSAALHDNKGPICRLHMHDTAGLSHQCLTTHTPPQHNKEFQVWMKQLIVSHKCVNIWTCTDQLSDPLNS